MTPKSHCICTECDAQHLKQKIGNVPAFSDISAKRKVREMVVQFVRQHGGEAPLLFIVDHFLPFDDSDHNHGSYLCEDLLGLYNVKKDRIFSPNIDPSVVDDLQKRGICHAYNSCACLFLQRFGYLIKASGGFNIAMPDVWGGFENGARRPIHVMLQEGLLTAAGAGQGPLRAKRSGQKHEKCHMT